MIGLVIWK